MDTALLISIHFHYITPAFGAHLLHSLALRVAFSYNYSASEIPSKKIPPPTSTSIEVGIEASRLDQNPRNFSSIGDLIWCLGKDDNSPRLKYFNVTNLCPFPPFCRCFGRILERSEIFSAVSTLCRVPQHDYDYTASIPNARTYYKAMFDGLPMQ